MIETWVLWLHLSGQMQPTNTYMTETACEQAASIAKLRPNITPEFQRFMSGESRWFDCRKVVKKAMR